MAIQRQDVGRLKKLGFHYTALPTEVIKSITDPAALAIYTYLMSQADGWVIRKGEIREHFDNMGEPKYIKAMKTLKDMRLCWVETIRDKGVILGNNLILSDIPVTDIEKTQPRTENTEITDIEETQSRLESDEKSTDMEKTQSRLDYGEPDPLQPTKHAASISESAEKTTDMEKTQSRLTDMEVFRRPVKPGPGETQHLINNQLLNKYSSSNTPLFSILKNQNPPNDHYGDRYALTAEWTPTRCMVDQASRVYYMEPADIEKARESFLKFHMEPTRAGAKKPAILWEQQFDQHCKVKSKEYRTARVNEPEWKKRGFESAEAMFDAVEQEAEQRAADRRKRAEEIRTEGVV